MARRVSDGPVTATVTLNGGGGTFTAAPAWVVVGPPKYAPAIQSPSSLYDTLLQVAKNKNLLPMGQPQFTLDGDVKPFFERLVNLQWVSELAAIKHSTIPATFPPGGSWPATLLGKLRQPVGASGPGATMPYIWSDTYLNNETVTALQYKMVQDWVAGRCPDRLSSFLSTTSSIGRPWNRASARTPTRASRRAGACATRGAIRRPSGWTTRLSSPAM